MTPLEFGKMEHFSFEELRELVALLRSPEGCSWDRAQTHESLRNNFVEEAYEVCEGIDQKNDALLCEELGDVLLQVLFHAGIAEDEGAFRTEDVIDGVAKKMVRRHPHVFSDSKERPDWEEIKRREKKEHSLKDTLLRISTSLPALKRGEKFLKKTEAISVSPPEDGVKDRLGTELYALCRKCLENGVDPEEALNSHLQKIIAKCTISD